MPVLETRLLPQALHTRFATLQPLGFMRPHAVSLDVRGLPTPAMSRWHEEGGMLTTWTISDGVPLATARVRSDRMNARRTRAARDP